MRLYALKIVLSILAIPALAMPVSCLIYILYKGIPALHWQSITGSHASAFGVAEALWPRIAGSMELMFGACLLATPVALGAILFYLLRATSSQQRFMRSLLHTLQGIPPIVYGLCGLMVLVYLFHWGISLLTGAVILAAIILPMLAFNILHAMERIPEDQWMAGRALGFSDGQMIRFIWLAQAWPGILTGLFLSMARALSETAPILFTATVFSGVAWPDSVLKPVTSLQTHIFYLAQEGADPRAVDAAWAAAVVLTLWVATLSISGLALRRMDR